ncbi:MAG: hypothetical protein WA740_09190, partial [Candidatus Binataceae bacterium]
SHVFQDSVEAVPDGLRRVLVRNDVELPWPIPSLNTASAISAGEVACLINFCIRSTSLPFPEPAVMRRSCSEDFLAGCGRTRSWLPVQTHPPPFDAINHPLALPKSTTWHAQAINANGEHT